LLDDAPLVTDDFLAFPGSRARFLPSDAERRRLLIRDALTWVLVAIIHLVFVSVMVISLKQNAARLGHRGAVESFLDLSLLHRNNAPAVNLIRPDVQNEDRDISAKPLTVIPVPPVIEMAPAAPTAGDILSGIGRFLACGASQFEYLNPAQQDRCQRVPWQAVQLPNGSLVLSAIPKLVIQETPSQFAGADALRQQYNTNSGCSLMVNAPCLSDMFTGNNSRAPGIPDPH
jgi:hypothetical protein